MSQIRHRVWRRLLVYAAAVRAADDNEDEDCGVVLFITNRRVQYFSYEQKSPEWLALRESLGRISIGGSTVAGWIGMSPYEEGDPLRTYRVAIGELPNEFKGNKYTKYGEKYEPRTRAICSAAFRVSAPRRRAERAGHAPAPVLDGPRRSPYFPLDDDNDRYCGILFGLNDNETTLPLRINEYGLFRDYTRRHIGASLDGETQAVRLIGYVDGGPPCADEPGQQEAPGNVCVDWTLGKCVWEAKANYFGLKDAPLVPHLMQVQFQMRLRGRHYGFLHYWYNDHTRVWLIRDSPLLWLWMQRRMDLARMHVVRRVPMTLRNPYFPWLRSPDGFFRRFCGCTTAEYLGWLWFGVDPTPAYEPKTDKGRASQAARRAKTQVPPPRADLTYADWVAELAEMRIRPGARPAGVPAPGQDGHDGWLYWSSDVPGGAETDVQPPATPDSDPCTDAGQLALPPCPEVWQVYEYKRAVPMDEIDLADENPGAPLVHDPDDLDWHAARFPSVQSLAAAQLDARHRIAHYDGSVAPYLAGLEWCDCDGVPQWSPQMRGFGPNNTRMRRLFITRLESVPELDEPEPVPDHSPATPEEATAYAAALERYRGSAKRTAADTTTHNTATAAAAAATDGDGDGDDPTQPSDKRRRLTEPATAPALPTPAPKSAMQILSERVFGSGGAAHM